MESNAKIYVVGSKGMVGSAIVRTLQAKGYNNLLLDKLEELDFCRQKEIEHLFSDEKPDYVFFSASREGGIVTGQEFMADQLYENIVMEMNILNAAWKNQCKKVLFLGSSCIYPEKIVLPIPEESLMTSELEKSNEAYAIAKISGMKYCEFLNKQYKTDYISVLPADLYGKNDNYDTTRSHVTAALIKRFHDAKVNNLPEVECWGTGQAVRDFMYVDDLADACVYLMNYYSGNTPINIGTGQGTSIKDLAKKVADIVGYEGKIVWNSERPDGAINRVLDVEKANGLGWSSSTLLETGLEITYQDFLKNK